MPPASGATTQPVDLAMRALSRSANRSRLWLAVAAVAALAPGRTRRAAVRGVGALAVTSLVTNTVLKPLTRRHRPPIERTPIARRLRRGPHTTSFPSGHAASAAAFTTGVAMESPALALTVAPLAAAVAYSRIHTGVHHVSDVLAGAAVGAGIALATRRWWPVRPHTPPAAREHLETAALTEGAGLVLVVNHAAGGGDDAAEQIRERLPRAEIIQLIDGITLDTELARRAPAAQAFGVVGGDGTIAAVAAAALRHDRPLAVFPAGTLNHFARDLGIESFEDTARALEAGDAIVVDVATVNDVAFVNTAVIGAYPEMVRRRDALAPRVGKWLAMAAGAAQVLRTQRPLSLEINGEPCDVWALFVGNGVYTPRGLFPAWRPRLDDSTLDVQFLRADATFARTRVVLATLAGTTERRSAYRTRLLSELQVASRTGPVQVAHDGEPGPWASSFRFRKLPGKLVIYRPAAH